MKKSIALVLVMLLCATFTMAAAEWEAGTSPSKPYERVPEVNLNEKIGYMFFYPNEEMEMVGGGRTLYIYLPRQDVEAGDGTFYLMAEGDGEIWRTSFQGSGVNRREMTEYELTSLMWGSGTCFEITVPKSLELGKTYFANLGEGCLKVTGSDVRNLTIGDTDSWRFSVTGDYGVNLMEYRRPLNAEGEYENEVTAPQAGDEVRFDIVLGGEATAAALYSDGDAVSFDSLLIENSGEVVGKVNSANPTWGIVFLNAQGEAIMELEL